ncbi:MAG TPA: SDR family oxidoreductase [Streptosporangiaceae bacterium]|nr:SDR family oxidoreductase [Streptosporangiaceae bacterium]
MSPPAAPAPAAQWRLDGRVALVTGASAGLGARFVKVLHAAGAHVIVTARRADRLQELAQHCGSRIETLAGDIADPDHRQLLAGLVSEHARLDVLVNNAGICDDGQLDSQSLDDLRHVVEVNLVSVMDMCRLTAGLLRAAPAASVINVASIYGVVASRGPMAAYNATKGGLISLTRHLAAVWGHEGIRVNALAPGYFPTELTGFLADPAFAQSIRDRTLLGRTPAPDELDGPLLFLATEASSYMTGQTLVIDGGWTAV